jgi:hypothetical protein
MFKGSVSHLTYSSTLRRPADVSSFPAQTVNTTSVYGTLVQGIWFNFEGKNIDIVGSKNATEGWIHCKFVFDDVADQQRSSLCSLPTSLPRLVNPFSQHTAKHGGTPTTLPVSPTVLT